LEEGGMSLHQNGISSSISGCWLSD
jgi:hypothetical protein